MIDAVFFLVLAFLVMLILGWGLLVLPREHMQILATLPRVRAGNGAWEGLNLTWYGVMQALGITLGLAVAIVLGRSLGVSPLFMFIYLPSLLLVSLVAARVVAGIVEKKRGTFTVGGAVFVGMLISLPVGWGLDAALGTADTLPSLIAAALGYPLGEGIGRLACISFGCCYGKRVNDMGPRWQRVFGAIATIPRGRTRKAVYAGNCAGESLVPTQALSAVFLSLFAIAGIACFLFGHPRIGATMALVSTHAFRFLIEFLRADNRGTGAVSPYQWMSLFSIPVVIGIFVFPAKDLALANVEQGLLALRAPGVVLGLAGTALAVFLYLGRSRVTFAILRFGVRDR